MVAYPCWLVLGSTGDMMEASVGSMHFRNLYKHWGKAVHRSPGHICIMDLPSCPGHCLC